MKPFVSVKAFKELQVQFDLLRYKLPPNLYYQCLCDREERKKKKLQTDNNTKNDTLQKKILYVIIMAGQTSTT